MADEQTKDRIDEYEATDKLLVLAHHVLHHNQAIDCWVSGDGESALRGLCRMWSEAKEEMRSYVRLIMSNPYREDR